VSLASTERVFTRSHQQCGRKSRIRSYDRAVAATQKVADAEQVIVNVYTCSRCLWWHVGKATNVGPQFGAVHPTPKPEKVVPPERVAARDRHAASLAAALKVRSERRRIGLIKATKQRALARYARILRERQRTAVQRASRDARQAAARERTQQAAAQKRERQALHAARQQEARDRQATVDYNHALYTVAHELWERERRHWRRMAFAVLF
jgi:hypothetical protein